MMNTLSQLQEILALNDLTEEDRRDISEHVLFEQHKGGDIIFNMHDKGNDMYIISKGKVRIYIPQPDGSEKHIADLNEKEFFGEMALVSEQPRSASAKALEDCDLIVLTKPGFFKLFNKNPDMASRISDEFLRRFNENLRNK